MQAFINSYRRTFIWVCMSTFLPTHLFSKESPLQILNGTSVGGGGDPLYYHLDVTRNRIHDVILKHFEEKELEQNPEPNAYRIGPFKCEIRRFHADHNLSEPQPTIFLDEERRNFCAQFFGHYALELKKLAANKADVPFVLSNEPLIAEGPDGKPTRFPAITKLEPSGPVWFDSQLVRTLGPRNVTLLTTHEFGHKLRWTNSEGAIEHIHDNKPIGPFSTGREFLDTLAAAVAYYADRHGLLGPRYEIVDQFYCVVTQSGGLPVRGAHEEKRVFAESDPFSYEAGFGYVDPTVGPSLQEEHSILRLRIKIKDEASCIQQSQRERFTRMDLVRDFSPTPDSPDPELQIVESVHLPAFNPMCLDRPAQITLQYKDIKFVCEYSKTKGSISNF